MFLDNHLLRLTGEAAAPDIAISMRARACPLALNASAFDGNMEAVHPIGFSQLGTRNRLPLPLQSRLPQNPFGLLADTLKVI